MKYAQQIQGRARGVGHICYLPILKKISAWVEHNKILVLGIYVSYNSWTFGLRRVRGHGINWRPPFSASVAQRSQYFTEVNHCDANGYSNIVGILPWGFDIKILTSPYATSATSVCQILNFVLKKENNSDFRNKYFHNQDSLQNTYFNRFWKSWIQRKGKNATEAVQIWGQHLTQ